MKLLDVKQLLEHLWCVEATISKIKNGTYRFNSNGCVFCSRYKCPHCTWTVMTGKWCCEARDKYAWIWLPYRIISLYVWRFKLKRRIKVLTNVRRSN